MTTYAAGLRVSEFCALCVVDIDGARDRMCIRVVAGKGSKDRYTLLSPSLLKALRLYWASFKPRLWLFPRASYAAQPQPQTRTKETWRTARLREVLPTYAYWVFTLPHAVNTLAVRYPRWLYGALLDSAATTLRELAASPRWLGSVPDFSLVLHTLSQDLGTQLHAHALIACGALDAEGQWRAPSRGAFLFPVQATSRVFPAKFLDLLDRVHRSDELPADPQGAPAAWHVRRSALLAPGHKRDRLAARAALQMPAPQPAAIEAAEAFVERVSEHDPRACPYCRHGRWGTVVALTSMTRAADPPAPRCRHGPP